MTSKNVNITTTFAPLGARNLSKTLTGLRLNPELVDYLSELDGELHLVLSPNTLGPSIRVAKRDNPNVTLATVREIEKLSNYKAIIGKKLEENKKESDLKEEIALFKNARSIYDQGRNPSPARILEANEQRFRMTQRQVELVTKQVEVIETLPASDARTYIISKAETLIKVLLDVMVACMGDHKYETETYHNLLLDTGVPRWIEKKLLDINFTKDVKFDASTLLFSKSNHMKSIGLTKLEIGRAGFLAANEFITRKSFAILALAYSDSFEDWIFRGLDGDEDLLRENYDKFSWPMLGNAELSEILQPRLNRNKLTGFSVAQAPKPKPGQDRFRPETAHQREIREMNNKLGMLVSTIVDFFHFVPRVDDPFNDVWSRLFVSRDWVITPENHLYQHINLAANRDIVLGHVRNNSLRIITKIMVSIVLMNLKIPESSTRGIELGEILSNLGMNDDAIVFGNLVNITRAQDSLTQVTLATLSDTAAYVDSDRNEILTFRGKRTTETRKGHKSDKEMIKNLKQTSPKVAKKLKSITDEKLRAEIGSWIKENFRHKRLQLLAAERAMASISDKNLGFEEMDYDSDEHSNSDSD